MRTVTVPNEVFFSGVKSALLYGDIVTVKVRGSSMLPFITGGRDSVTLQNTDLLLVGDIVLAEIKQRYFLLHRIVKIEGENIVLMGDGNLFARETCLRKNIAGKVISITRNGRHIEPHSATEQTKVRLWRIMLPLRKYLLAMIRRI